MTVISPIVFFLPMSSQVRPQYACLARRVFTKLSHGAPLKALLLLGFVPCLLSTCGVVKGTWKVGKTTVVTTYKVSKGAAKLTVGTLKAAYKIGGFTFRVVMAPLTWPLIREEIESIDDLPPKEAIKRGG